MFNSVGGQSDPSAQGATQAQATAATTSTSASMSNGVALATLLSSMTTLVNSASASSDAGSGSIASQAAESGDASPTGLSDSQRVSGKEGDAEDGGEGREEPEGHREVNYTGSTNLTGITPMNTSGTADVAEGIDLRSSQALAAANAAAAKNGFLAPNLASYSTSINSLSSNLANAASTFGLSSETVSQASSCFEKAGSIATQLSNLSAQGAATQSATIKLSTQINDSVAQAYTAIFSDLSQNPQNFANALTSSYGASPEAANQIANAFSILTGSSSQTTSSGATSTPLNSTGGMTYQMDAVGGFAMSVSNGTALLDNYAALLYSTNATIGTETAQESDVTTANLQKQITKQENEEAKEKREQHKRGLLGKIFHPFSTAMSYVTPAITNFAAQTIHAIVPEISTSQAKAGIKDISPKALSNDMNKGIQDTLKAGAGALCKMIPGLSMSAATEFMEIGFKAMTNPMGTEMSYAMKGVGDAIVAADPNAKSSVNDTENIGNSFINDEATMMSPISTPTEKFQAMSSGMSLAMTSVTTGITNLVCLADPKANRDEVNMAVSISLIAVFVVAGFFTGGATDEVAGAELAEMAGEGAEGGEEAGMGGRSAIQAGDGAQEDAVAASNAKSESELTTNTLVVAEGVSAGSSSLASGSSGDSATAASKGAAEDASIEEENVEAVDEEGTGRAAVTPGDGAQEDATAAATTTGGGSSTTAASKGAEVDASAEDEEVEDTSEEGAERAAIVPGDGAQEDATAAASSFKTGMSGTQMMNLALNATMTFQGIGTILTSALTIQESIQEIAIASLTYDLQVSNSILELLQETSNNTNTSTTNNTSNIFTITGNLNTANGLMSADAAADLQA